jgi:2-hydroxychromene-2-carboxylate isomerase
VLSLRHGSVLPVARRDQEANVSLDEVMRLQEKFSDATIEVLNSQLEFERSRYDSLLEAHNRLIERMSVAMMPNVAPAPVSSEPPLMFTEAQEDALWQHSQGIMTDEALAEVMDRVGLENKAIHVQV